MKIHFKYDSRDKVFQQKFGQVLEFPDELNFDRPLFDDIQPLGDVKCVAFSVCDAAEDQTGIEFDINDLWQRVPSTPYGSDPRDVFGKATSKKEDGGLLPRGKTIRDRRWISYWRADIGNQDPFDNCRSTMMLIKCPITAGTYWYREWHGADILPIGKTPQNGHAYSIEGWKTIGGEPYLIVEPWLGRKLYMSREVFNKALKPYGMQTWALSTSTIDERRKLSLTEQIKDLMINLIIWLRDKIKTYKVEPVVPSPISPVIVLQPLETPSKYDWDTPILARHSVRVICDEMGMSVDNKNIFCAVMGAESGWNPKAVGKPNKNGTIDYGICQINSYYWIGEGKPFPSKEYVLSHPEECVRWAIKQWKAGHRSYWWAYTNGSFAKYL